MGEGHFRERGCGSRDGLSAQVLWECMKGRTVRKLEQDVDSLGLAVGPGCYRGFLRQDSPSASQVPQDWTVLCSTEPSKDLQAQCREIPVFHRRS